MSEKHDPNKEKFRPDSDTALDAEVEAALAGLSEDELYGDHKTSSAQEPSAVKGSRTGTIISIDPKNDAVFVDFGGKSQGVVPFRQFEEEPKVGAVMEFFVDRYDAEEGLLMLNRKGSVASNVSWENLEVGQVVEGLVTGVNKGGLELTVKGMRAFMPAGQVDLFFNKDISVFLNQKMLAEVTQFESSSRNLVLSRRNVLEREREELKQKTLGEIAEGQVRRGTIRSVMDYGAFVDLGGIDGLVHVSEITHRRGIKPSEFVKVGDVVDVKIIRIDRETGKLSLSLKQMMADPWIGAEGKYAVGAQVTGRVSKVENFGAFVEVEEGVEGLLPASEISWQRVRHPSDVVKEGDTLRLVVINLDTAAKKISFSLKQAGPNPWATVTDRYATDMVVDGKVTRLADFGAFVEVEAGLEGLVHVSEIANHRVRTPGDVVKVGDEVKVKVLEIDKESRRMSLSIKRATEAIATAAATPTAAPAPQQKKRKTPLKGGIDWGWQ